MRGNLSNGIVSIKIQEGSKRPVALHEKSKFGKIEADFLHLSLIEACYLQEKGRLNIYEDDVECSVGYLIDLLKQPVVLLSKRVSNMVLNSDCMIVEEVQVRGTLIIWLRLFLRIMISMHWILPVMLGFPMVLTRSYCWQLWMRIST